MKKLLTALLTGAAAISFTACGKKNTLVIGTNAAFPPFEYKENGNITGFDMDLIRKYGESVGKKIEIKDMDFDAALTSASTGKIDIAILLKIETPCNSEAQKKIFFYLLKMNGNYSYFYRFKISIGGNQVDFKQNG